MRGAIVRHRPAYAMPNMRRSINHISQTASRDTLIWHTHHSHTIIRRSPRTACLRYGANRIYSCYGIYGKSTVWAFAAACAKRIPRRNLIFGTHPRSHTHLCPICHSSVRPRSSSSFSTLGSALAAALGAVLRARRALGAGAACSLTSGAASSVGSPSTSSL